MQNRLDFFREKMAAFEASANPKSAIDRGYYVEEPGGSISSKMLRRLEIRPSSSHILVGGIGSGKTTQLLKIEKDLNSASDTFVKYIDVSEYENISNLSSSVFIAIAGLVIADLVETLDKEAIAHINSIKAEVYGSTKLIQTSQLLGMLGRETKEVELKGIFSKKKNILLNAIKSLIPKIKSHINHLIILFDGLDRLSDSRQFMDLLISDLPVLRNLEIGSAVIAPLSTFYRQEDRETIKQISQYSDYYQVCYDIENDSEAKNFLERIIMTRASTNFIENKAVEKLVQYSGGVIRDLISLTQLSVEEAYIHGEDKVLDEHVHSAMLSFSGAQFLGLSNREMGILERVVNDQEFYPKTEEEFKLLLSRRILEYTHPKRRFVVHPAIQMGLKEQVA